MKRRTFLSVTGGVAVASALHPSLTKAQAQPKRLLVVFTPDGTVHNAWRPQGSATDFTLPTILKPFEALRDDLLVLDGVENRVFGSGDGDEHEQGMTQMLTGRPNRTSGATSTGISLDEYVHQHISEGRPALRVGVGSDQNYVSNWTRMTYDENGSAIHPRQSPYQARDAIFPAGFDPTGGGGGGGGGIEPSEAELRAKAIREGAIQFANSQLGTMANRLRGLDQQRVMSHAGSLSTLLAGGGGDPGPVPLPTEDLVPLYDRIRSWPTGISASPTNFSRFPDVARMQMELITAAFAFDRSRVAVLQFSESNSKIKHNAWTGCRALEHHHELSHRQGGGAGLNTDPDLIKIYTWYAQQIATLATELKSYGLLENTVIFWMTDMRAGGDHEQFEVPMTIIGGGNHFQTGLYKDYRSSGGVSHTSVLTSICNAMGLPDTRFGARNEGPLTGVT